MMARVHALGLWLALAVSTLCLASACDNDDGDPELELPVQDDAGDTRDASDVSANEQPKNDAGSSSGPDAGAHHGDQVASGGRSSSNGGRTAPAITQAGRDSNSGGGGGTKDGEQGAAGADEPDQPGGAGGNTVEAAGAGGGDEAGAGGGQSAQGGTSGAPAAGAGGTQTCAASPECDPAAAPQTRTVDCVTCGTRTETRRCKADCRWSEWSQTSACTWCEQCSRVVYCDAPGERGTWCVQEGCSREQADADCKEDVKEVCGQVTEPFFMEYSDNEGPNENCAEVVYCNAPADDRGTWCKQLACTREQADADCKRDIKALCGEATEPLFVEYLDAAAEDCAEVVYCDAPDADRGTWCKQSRCTREQAERECKQDIAAVCGSVTEPYFFEAR